MAGNASNQRIIPLEEGWNDEIKAKVRKEKEVMAWQYARRIEYLALHGVRVFGTVFNGSKSSDTLEWKIFQKIDDDGCAPSVGLSHLPCPKTSTKTSTAGY
jgi:hypothetical protein